MADLIEFDTGQIADIAGATASHQADWDRIWSDVKAQIAGTVSEALDAYTGGSLEERSARYASKTAEYTQSLQAQAGAVGKIGMIATETNAAMTKTIQGV